MTGIELYIENQLADTENLDNFSIYLRRLLINPSELSAKDAQRSYDVTLPASTTNNAIFGYTNTEEVRNKFAQLYNAVLYAGGVKVFDGKFKISEITKHHYKGNLGVPVAKTAKDIFGEKKMNEAGKWYVPYSDPSSMNNYNLGTIKEASYCFFPHVLYGLIYKNPSQNGTYTPKNVLDNTVPTFGKDDFPPSINCLEALKKIFENQKLKLSGTAFDDKRLKNLFMSYKNPNEYAPVWNVGKDIIDISGTLKVHDEDNGNDIELNSFIQNYGLPNQANVDTVLPLFNRVGKIDVKRWGGDQVKRVQHTDSSTDKCNTEEKQITINADGLYKIKFNIKSGISNGENTHFGDDEYGYYTTGRTFKNDGSFDLADFAYNAKRHEVKLLRYTENEYPMNDRASMSKTFDALEYDNIFYDNNINQEVDDAKYPKHFPKSGEVNFIDSLRDKHLLCGFSFGPNNGVQRNPLGGSIYHNVIAIRGGQSWNGNSDSIRSAVGSTGYYSMQQGDDEKDALLTEMLKVDIANTPTGGNYTKVIDNFHVEGQVCQIVELKRGDRIVIASTMDNSWYYKLYPIPHTDKVYFEKRGAKTIYQMDYDLVIEPFRSDVEWMEPMTAQGNTEKGKSLNWTDPKTFEDESINLINFLPSDEKIDDWITNFCKAFNLQFVQLAWDTYELNTRRVQTTENLQPIYLEPKTTTDMDRKNTSLNLPSAYKIGFTVDKEEEGYYDSFLVNNNYNQLGKNEGDTGGGIFLTTSPEVKVMEQTSKFSFNWFKQIIDKQSGVEYSYHLPVISKKEVWGGGTYEYQKEMAKTYFNLPQRFWYKKQDNMPTVKRILEENKKTFDVQMALVSNTFDEDKEMMTLDYTDLPNSIMRSYFTMLTNAGNSYTTVECYLTPEEYNALPNCIVHYNGDVYYAAEVDAFDPLGKKKASLKLIRKLNE